VEHLRQARRFALAYTPAGLDRLCKVIVSIQSGQEVGRPIIGPAAIVRLLSVPASQRDEFVKLAAQNAWSFKDIEREIRARFGRRRKGGRRRLKPTSLPGFLAEAEKWCEAWRRWQEQSTADLGNEPAPDPLKGLPDDLRILISRVTKVVRQFQEAVWAELATKKVSASRSPDGKSDRTNRRRKRSRVRPKR
jgi:hypothetical protein